MSGSGAKVAVGVRGGQHLELADRMWRGEIGHREWNRSLEGGVAMEVAPDTLCIASRGIVGNVTALRTNEGLILIDTGTSDQAEAIYKRLREWDRAPVRAIIYTHGHVDHVGGAHVYDREADEHGWTRPEVMAQRNVRRRFDRYQLTAGWNTHINRRQFRRGALAQGWPTEYRYPDRTYLESLHLEIGGLRIGLQHGRGETDDQTWIWVPQYHLLIAGDFVIWAAPNSGNPQKVQRYTGGWAKALAAMGEVGAEILVPGHGPPVHGAERIAELLSTTRRFLAELHERTIGLMNQGLRLSEICERVKASEELLELPYLKPTYDDPEFLVRNIWRQYGGWYDGNPANLKPAPEAALAREIAELAGGAERLAVRARELSKDGESRLAAHLAEMAVLADGKSLAAQEARAEVYEGLAASEPTLMARGIYGEAAEEAAEAAKALRSRKKS